VASSGIAACVAPADYSELFLEFGEDIKRVVWRQLGPAAQREDVDDGVSYILQQFIKRDLLALYRPDYVSDFNHRPVTFKAFLMGNVAVYCKGLRETLGRRLREPLLLDDPSAPDGISTLLGTLGTAADEYPSLSDSEVMENLRTALAARSPVPGSQPVLPLFDALAARFGEGKSVTAAAVRTEFGMSREQADAWFGELKTALRDVGSRASRATRFELGGLMLSAAEVRSAIDALKGSRGNRVLPAFIDSGHPLAAAGKTWYLGFAAGVMEQHPEMCTAKGGHYEGGHFGRVKHALIYGLEQLLDAAPVTVPVPVPVAEPVVAAVVSAPWDELQGVLLRFPGLTPETAEAALEAVRLLVAA
jgi:hypothetical protein